LPNALVTPRAELLGELWAGQGQATLIQHHHPLTGLKGSQYTLTLNALLVARLPFPRLGQHHLFHRKTAHQPTQVVLHPVGHKTTLTSPYQQQPHPHSRKLVRKYMDFSASTWPGICQISEQMTIKMMRTLVLLVSMVLAIGLFAQDDVKSKVVQAMRTGNSKELAVHFIPNIDLTVKETADVYSKAQAEQIIRKFFNDNPPVDMVIEHTGVSKVGDKYYIGILRTNTGYFRVTFFLKKTDAVFQVKQLRIENSKNDF
jgi:hypothetical protein